MTNEIEIDDIQERDTVEWRETHLVKSTERVLGAKGYETFLELEPLGDGKYFLVHRPDPEKERKDAIQEAIHDSIDWRDEEVLPENFIHSLKQLGYSVVKDEA